MYRLTNLARVALLGAVVTTAACQSENLAIAPTANNDLFKSYVAIGNSITAGYQSGGINDSTQRRSARSCAASRNRFDSRVVIKQSVRILNLRI